MLTELEKSKVHIVLNRALNIPETPESDTDRRKAGLALVVSRYGGDPECSFVLAVSDAIQDFTAGNPAIFEIANVMNVTDLDRQMCEVALMVLGACQKSPLTWCVGGNGEPVTLPRDLMQRWVQQNFTVAS